MKLEDQVCSLELAKRLKELGVKQESLFYFQNNPYNDGQGCIDLMIKESSSKNGENTIINTECENNDNPKYSAFTASELGEMLPDYVELVKIQNIHLATVYAEDNGAENNVSVMDDTEANVRAKILIYLLENNIISHS